MEFSYKLADIDDVDAIVNMQNKLTNMLGLCDDTDNEVLKDYLIEEIQAKNSIYFIAKYQADAIGVICIDFNSRIKVDDEIYSASIPLIFVDEKYRQGKIAFNLFKLALREIKQKGLNSCVIAVEENNPNKYLHFSIANQIIEEREELQEDDKTIKQYILGISSIHEVCNLSFKEIAKRSIYTKNNFKQILKCFPIANSINYEL